jgi:hypothetical protein
MNEEYEEKNKKLKDDEPRGRRSARRGLFGPDEPEDLESRAVSTRKTRSARKAEEVFETLE